MLKKAVPFLVVLSFLLVLGACAPPATPEKIVETVVVIETVEVEKEVVVTVEVEKEVIVTVEVPAAVEESEVGGQLNIIGWEGYEYQPAFQAFYDEYGVVPNNTYIGNNDEIISKFKAGGPGVYDLGDINSRYLQAMAKQGMIIPLDEEKIPNMKDIFPAFDEREFGVYEGKRYAVPAFFGPSGLCYRADMVDEPDWDYYKDPQYQGKYAVTTNPLASMYVWGMTLGKGQDATKWTLDDLEEMKARGMEEWKYAVTTAASTGEQADLLVRGDVVLTTDCWEGVVSAAQEQGVDVKMTVPPGETKIWVDLYFILDGAPNPETAYAWINHALSPTAMKIMAEYLGVAVASQRAFEIIDPELAEFVGYDALNELIMNADFNVLPDADAEPPYVSLDDLYKAFDEIQATGGQ